MDCKWAHEKMFNIISHCGTVSQIYAKIPLYTYQATEIVSIYNTHYWQEWDTTWTPKILLVKAKQYGHFEKVW